MDNGDLHVIYYFGEDKEIAGSVTMDMSKICRPLPCDAEFCSGNGACSGTGSLRSCDCKSGYAGTNCEIAVCDDKNTGVGGNYNGCARKTSGGHDCKIWSQTESGYQYVPSNFCRNPSNTKKDGKEATWCYLDKPTDEEDLNGTGGKGGYGDVEQWQWCPAACTQHAHCGSGKKCIESFESSGQGTGRCILSPVCASLSPKECRSIEFSVPKGEAAICEWDIFAEPNICKDA